MHQQATGSYRKALAIAQAAGEPRTEGGALFNLSREVYEMGGRDLAIRLAFDALDIYQRIEDRNAFLVVEQLEEWQSGLKAG
jgi:hypothetical protein